MAKREKSAKRIRHADTAYRLGRELERRLNDHFHHVRYMQLPIDNFADMWEVSKQQLGYSRLPRHWQEYLSGYYRAKWDAFWIFADWRVFWRGQYYHSSKTGSGIFADRRGDTHGSARPDSEIETGTWNEVDSKKGRHFWVGSDKPFGRPLPEEEE